MKAIHVDTESADRALRWQETPDPQPGPGQVGVEVHAAAANRADLLQRAGHYPPPEGASEILGLEMAGVITDLGPGVDDWRPGDRVCALLDGGGYAERVVVDARQLLPVPAGWDLTRAAAVPEVFLTAWVNLFCEAGLRAGESVLVHAGASGVGTAAIQLARVAGCRVLATAGTEAKRERCRQLGAEQAWPWQEHDFAADLLEHLPGGVDVILDVGAASHLERNLTALARRGRLVLIALLGGPRGDIDLGAVLRKNLRLIGSTLRSRPAAEKGDIIAGFRAQFWSDIEAGRIEPVIDRVLPVTEAGAAHAALEANETIGKVVLEVRPPSASETHRD